MRKFEADHDDYLGDFGKRRSPHRLAEAFASACTRRCAASSGASGARSSERDLIASATAAFARHTAIRPVRIIRRRRRLAAPRAAGAGRHRGSPSTTRDAHGSVDGWYLSHPEARYFGHGKLGRDQVVVTRAQGSECRRKRNAGFRPSSLTNLRPPGHPRCALRQRHPRPGTGAVEPDSFGARPSFRKNRRPPGSRHKPRSATPPAERLRKPAA